MNTQQLSADIAIFGGGIAGLWALNRLQALGYECLLFETHSLGNGQTVKSQGIIHGGIKYALTGFLNKSANAVEDMPKRWKKCLAGSGEIDLSQVKILSHDQLLWSTGTLASEITSFFASLALKSRVKKLAQQEYPIVLQHDHFKGQVYRLDEVVLDPLSLIQVLAKPYQSRIFKINGQQGYQFHFDPKNPNHISKAVLQSGSNMAELNAKLYLFAAGEGNEQLSAHLDCPPPMQRRPLQMVMVKLEQELPFFAHCIEQSTNPRITITSQTTRDHKTLWYLGGQLAEDGATRNPASQIAQAKNELTELFPWLDLKQATWGSFFINRAEPKQPNGKRPDNAFMECLGNTLIAWPTKLALAPLLTDTIIEKIKKMNITPKNDHSEFSLPLFEKPNFTQSLEDILLTSPQET